MIFVSEDELNIIIEILKKYLPVGEVRAFGSRYKWTAKDYSDLDLAIVKDDKIPFMELAGIQDAFVESELTFRVEVLDYWAVSDEFRKVIDEGYEVIYKVEEEKLNNSSNLSKEWKKVKLGEVCEYAKDKIAINKLTLENYISTENMLPDKAGITKSCGTPKINNTSAYNMGNTLISNIRPYFKKIWYADKSGGCSNDVLVFKPKNIHSKYLYYLLSDDSFFEYSMLSSKGTKMPRGDKIAIMNYFVSLPPIFEQHAIAKTLSCLDDKIELNNRINKKLEEMAQAIFKSWFVDFEPFKEGEFVESELGMIPKGWRVGILEDTTYFKNGKKKTEKQGKYPVYGGNGILGYSAEYNAQNVIIIGRVGAYCGNLYFEYNKCWISDNAICAKSRLDDNQWYCYQMLQYQKLNDRRIGSGQPLLTQSILDQIKCIIPPFEMICKYNNLLTPIYKELNDNQLQSNNLITIRDTLLPKLMNGKIRIPIKEENSHV